MCQRAYDVTLSLALVIAAKSRALGVELRATFDATQVAQCAQEAMQAQEARESADIVNMATVTSAGDSQH